MSLRLENMLKLNDISPDLIIAANRFNETTEDGQEYDVLPQLMSELAEIGLVESKGSGIYFQTDLMMEMKVDIKIRSDKFIAKTILTGIKNAITN